MTLTIEQAKSKCANFIYIWASDPFLSAVKHEYAVIIKQKQVNQRLLLRRSAEKYRTTQDMYIQAIREEFINQFGMTPYDALIKLALGEEVAGKNWAKGVYGVGAVRSRKFKDGYSVGEENGTIIDSAGNLCATDQVIYGSDGNPFQITSYDNTTGLTYVSEKASNGKWFAKSYSDADGNMFSASGASMTGSDAGSVWELAELSFDWLDKIINWILSLFGASTDTGKEQLTPENTLINQKKDGFVYQSGLGEAGGVMLLLAAGGALMASGALDGKKKK